MSQTTPTMFWNDNCAPEDIKFAIEHGCVGATTNPVIVGQVLEADLDTYVPVIKEFIAQNPFSTEDEIAWLVNEKMAVDGAKLLYPIFMETGGRTGFISIQTNTKYYKNYEKLAAQAKHFSGLAKNIMVKIPATAAGITAIEESTYQGVNVNATISFSVSQALAVAEAIKRAMERRAAEGLDNSFLHPVCTIMVGRVDDWLHEVCEAEDITVDPNAIVMAGVAVFKHAYQIYKKRGYHTQLLSAAYRHHHHWSEFIGGNVSQTIPPMWIRRFVNSSITVENRMDNPVDPKLLDQLKKQMPEFLKVYEEDGMMLDEFDHYGATRRTLMQFFSGYDKMVNIVRKIMIEA